MIDKSSPLYQLAALPPAAENPMDALAVIVENTRSLIDADKVVFFELDEHGGFNPLVAAPSGLAVDSVGRLPFASANTPLGQAIAARAPVAARATSDMLAKSLGLAAVAYAPALVSDDLIGLLVAGRRDRDVFDADELELLSIVSRRAGGSLYFARRMNESSARLNELSLIVQTITDVSSSLDLDAVLKSIAVNMLSATSVQGVTLSTWDRAGDSVVTLISLLRGVSRPRQDRPGATYPLRDYPATRGVLETRKPLQTRVSDPGADERQVALMQELGIQSLLVLPLIARGEVIGLVELHEMRGERPFSAREVELAQALANQAAVAMLNAQLYRATEARAAELALINKIGRHVTASLDLDQTLQRVIRRTRQVLNVEACVLLLRDETTGYLVRHSAEPGSASAKPQRLRLGEGIAGWVMSHAQPRMVTDILSDPQFSNSVDQATGLLTRSVVCVPLAARENRLIGVIEAINKLEGRFSASDMNLLGSVASWAAAAIEHAKLYTETEQRAQELAVRNAVSQSLTASLDLEVFLPAVANHFARLAGGSSCHIVLWDEARQITVAMAAYGDPHDAYPNMGLSPGAPTLTEVVVKQRAPVIIHDVAYSAYVSPAIAEQVPDRSLLALPLETAGQVLGAVIIGHAEEGHFHSEHVKHTLPIAQQVALAVANAQLFARAEEERHKLNAVLHDTADPVIVTDMAGKVTLVNRAAETAFGWAPDQALGKAAAEVFPRGADRSLADLLTDAPLGDQPDTVELESPTGRTYEATVSRVVGVGRATVMRDITYLKQLDRMRTELVGTAAHDLKSPLASIQLAVDLMATLGGLSDKQVQHAAAIRRAVRQMVALITDLLEITRIEAGIVLKLSPCRVADYVQMVSAALATQAAAQHITVQQDFQPDLPPVEADPARLRQILTNLLSNAVKYTPAGGTVKFSAQSENDHVLIQVTDSGMGISPSDLPKVFDRFFRAEDVIAQDIEGTGLGLSIVKSIVERHGGNVRAESVEDQGTTFSFTLPRAKS